ncbi:MAG: glycosyltransferase family 4 protein [Geobacteraceae bacterium]|nr:glycosyltransferase family 4 protein [Geobacteraceae bacterium]
MFKISRDKKEGLLCVANFRANTGYAWDFIESLFLGVAMRLKVKDIDTYVVYPEIKSVPCSFKGTSAKALELEVNFGSVRSLIKLIKLIVSKNIRTVYLTDRAVFHPAYFIMRLFGIRHIVVHDHTSGAKTIPTGVKYWLKWLTRKLPGMQANIAIGVSDFVAKRLVDVSLVPKDRVRRIWNSVTLPQVDVNTRKKISENFGLPEDTFIILCACRSTKEKGVEKLLYAFDKMCKELDCRVGLAKPFLIYMGNGPIFDQLVKIKGELASRDKILFAGYRPDAAQLTGGADLCVVPSLWEEAFCLAALEPMAQGVPVIASQVGGIPEVVVNGETGIIVEPGDVNELCKAMLEIYNNPIKKRNMGEKGRQIAMEKFSREDKLDDLSLLIGLGYNSFQQNNIIER